jgi:hypothetical protein
MRTLFVPSNVRLPAVMTAIFAMTLLSGAQAAVVWSDDFSGSERGATAPNPYNFPGGAGTNDYTVTSVAGVTFSVSGGISGVLNTADTSTAGATPNIAVFGNQFAPASYPAGTQVTLEFDIRVNSMIAATAASAPRLSIINANAEVFTVGFSHAAFTGSIAGGDALGFYYGTTAGANINPANGIGVSTFNFGVYSSTTAANNDTNAGSGLDFFRVTLSLTQGSTAVTGSITDLGTSTTVSFPGTTALTTALNWSGVTQDGFRFTTGLSGTSNYDIDNVSVSVVPEPSAALLGGCGLLGWIGRRRRC